MYISERAGDVSKETPEKNSKGAYFQKSLSNTSQRKLQDDFRDYVLTFCYRNLFSYVGDTDVFEKPVSSETLETT
jgi:hypothetical protein